MITVRTALGSDVEGIKSVFSACYGPDYAYPQYYDVEALTRLVYSDDNALLVAEDTEAKKVVATASVILEIGAFADMVGEFGRLAVLPEYQNHGLGQTLMEERLRRVRDQLHVGLIEARIVHPYTLKISEGQNFAVAGLLPLKMQFARRESSVLLVKYFGEALKLRRNNPRIIPEAFPIAHEAMSNCGIECDVIIDEDSTAYPQHDQYTCDEMTTDAYTGLLRIERGRIKNREIFGPCRLHYGFFKLQTKKARYLVARDDGRIAGAVGFAVDPIEHAVRVFELISVQDEAIRFLLANLERLCRDEWHAAYVEVDVSAYAPRMQRTLLQLGFSVAAYVPALAFHDVERLDVVKMVRLLVPLELGEVYLTPAAERMAALVLRGFASQEMLPRIAQTVESISLFSGLNDEQLSRIGGVFKIKTFAPDEIVFRVGEKAEEMLVVLSGEANIALEDGNQSVGTVCRGECLGEISMLSGTSHSATARAVGALEAAAISHADFAQLVRQRPDIGAQVYKNLAAGLGEKLCRTDSVIAYRI